MGRDRSGYELLRLVLALALGAVVVFVIELRSSGSDGTSLSAPVAGAAVEAVEAVEPPTGRTALTIAVTGEILPHPSIVDYARRFGEASGAAYDFAPLFADLAPELAAADLAICHLEVPVAPPGSSLSGYPSFGIPAEVGAGIAATGWDRCSTASNHSNDKGSAGIRATIDALAGAGVGHSGTSGSIEESMTVPIAAVDDVRIAHLSYTWGFNGTPPAEPWMADVIDVERILSTARRARAEGAAIVVVSLHWGVEYDTAGSDDQRRLADRLLASPDIDLIVGHGPHVLQPIERFHGKYALLSVGNLIANQGRERPRTYDGVIATIAFSDDGSGSWQAAAPVVRPTWYDRDAGRVRLVPSALVDTTLAHRHSDFEASVDRVRAVIGPYVDAS